MHWSGTRPSQKQHEMELRRTYANNEMKKAKGLLQTMSDQLARAKRIEGHKARAAAMREEEQRRQALYALLDHCRIRFNLNTRAKFETWLKAEMTKRFSH
jgi:hypothetical protein